MSTDSYYFAYGSNMNPDRVRQRLIKFDDFQAGILHDYRMTFNKRSAKFIGSASANVMLHKGAQTEGVIYRLIHADEIVTMDPYEGYPLRYDRLLLTISCQYGLVDAWVYVANQEYIDNNLKPNRWYLQHLLAGREFLSNTYIEQLEAVECLPDSDIEPQ